MVIKINFVYNYSKLFFRNEKGYMVQRSFLMTIRNALSCRERFPVQHFREWLPWRKIKLIEGNAKCRHLKKFASKGTLPQVFICLRPRNPYPLTTYTVYTLYLFTQGGGGESWEGQRSNGSKNLVKSTNMTDCITSIWTFCKHLPQSLFTDQFF